MTDRISKDHRSWNMSKIRSKDTSPEKRVRSFLHKRGFRFRLHDKTLPGRPDIVLKKYRTAIFVHGCYWHRHQGCKNGQYFPKSPRQGKAFWENKFERNVKRDIENTKRLEEQGWRVFVVWECMVNSEASIENSIKSLLITKSEA